MVLALCFRSKLYITSDDAFDVLSTPLLHNQHDLWVSFALYCIGVWPNECFQGAGMQGFQNPLVEDSFIVDGVGALGQMQSERGLTYIEIPLAGQS